MSKDSHACCTWGLYRTVREVASFRAPRGKQISCVSAHSPAKSTRDMWGLKPIVVEVENSREATAKEALAQCIFKTDTKIITKWDWIVSWRIVIKLNHSDPLMWDWSALNGHEGKTPVFLGERLQLHLEEFSRAAGLPQLSMVCSRKYAGGWPHPDPELKKLPVTRYPAWLKDGWR